MNLPGDQEAGAWLFLLPGLDLRRVVVVGSAPRGTRAAFTALGADVFEAPRRTAAALESRVDLVYVDVDRAQLLAHDEEALAALRQLIGAGCSVYISTAGGGSRSALALMTALGVSSSVHVGDSRGASRVVAVGGGPAAWLVPDVRARELPRVVRGIRRMSRRVLRLPAPATPERLLAVSHVAAGAVPPGSTDGVLIHADRPAPALPRYLRDVALRAGRDLGGVTWALAPPRGYRSQKVVFHLPERGEIVKITQDPRFNVLLRTEYDALVALQQSGWPRTDAAPRPLFAGEHAGLLVIGESRLVGAPFRDRSDGTATCPIALETLETLVELASAEAREWRGSEVAEALAELLEQYVRVYDVPAEAHFLERHIELIDASGSAFVTAFSHGDPTTHNVLVDSAGGVGLVDWENAECFGMPLWDLLRFMSAYAAWSSRLAGRRWTVPLACSTLFEPSPFHQLLGQSIARYRSRTGLAEELVPPLLVTCLMTDALRQITRLPPGSRKTSHAARLLARLAAGGGHAGLQGLARARVQ